MGEGGKHWKGHRSWSWLAGWLAGRLAAWLAGHPVEAY